MVKLCLVRLLLRSNNNNNNTMNDNMKMYTIPVVWQMMGTVTIAADSLDDAIEQALDDGTALPTNGSYLEGSSEVDGSVYNDYENDIADNTQNEVAEYTNQYFSF